MKNKTHNCPFLDKYKNCTHKYGSSECIYSNKEKCPRWQHSPTLAENVVRCPPKRVKNDSGKDVRYQ